MFEFEKKRISSNIGRFRIIVEKTENYDISGILYNDFYGIAFDFKGIRQMMSCLDELFDYVGFPQASHQRRSFHENKIMHTKQLPHGIREVPHEEMADKSATFLLHVQFRQNSTWQGTLEWLPQGKTKRFRSELEMIGLIAEALNK